MIKTVKNSGFCQGVKAAVDKANYHANNTSKKVYLFGDLANNRIVMDNFRSKGLCVIENTDNVAPNSVVIIRAHGVPKSVYSRLKEKGVEIEDCTCPKVKSIHKIVEEKSQEGYVIIVGKAGHPEVVGSAGWCKGENVIIAETEDGLKKSLTSLSKDVKLAVVAQTTCKISWWNKAVEMISKAKPNAEIFNTLCNVTGKKIEEATELSKQTDIMVVVGDEKSANSKELYSACHDVCKNTIFVTDLTELIDCPISFEKSTKIGIVGSASTPVNVIEEIHDYLNFALYLTTTKDEIENSANNYIEKMIENTVEKPFIKNALKNLHQQNQGGKRIRGVMIKLGAEITASKNNYLPVATAYEIFQTAILIHDDIIDKSFTRRGKKTIHAIEKEEKEKEGLDKESATHFGISQAICIGDYGLFLATNILAKSDLESVVFKEIMHLFSEIQLKTLEGEIMDVTLPYEPINIFNNYDEYTNIVNKIFEYKTAWYTLIGPIMLGALCGRANDSLLQSLKNITLPLGVAFQIKDDLLGVYASEKVLGKPALSDLIEKKQTLLYGYAYKHADDNQRVMLDKSYGNVSANENDLKIVREIFESTGAKHFMEQEICRLSGISLELINKSNIADNHKVLLRGLVSYLITRRY